MSAPEILKMMADRDLCEPCATRMATLPPGMVGTWICRECAARHATKDAAEAAARKALGHPAPWRWDTHRGLLVDAVGERVIRTDDVDAEIIADSPRAAALLAAAPEMEALLRDIITRLDQRPGGDIDRDTCPLCGKFHFHAKDCPYELGGELLARVDAAKAAK